MVRPRRSRQPQRAAHVTDRVWDASTIIAYLRGEPGAEDCVKIVAQAERGETRIVVPTLALTEVAKLPPNDDDEGRIREFFQREYVIGVVLDTLIAERARQLVRNRRLKPEDAIYVATALQHRIPVLETFDANSWR